MVPCRISRGAKRLWLTSSPNHPIRRAHRQVALTVAGQWRSFTAFPSILTIALVNFAARSESSLYAMERLSMTSTFIARLGREVKASDSAALEFKVPRCFIVRLKDLWEIMVTPGRLELPTRSLGNCCSIHLSYGATFRINGLRRS